MLLPKQANRQILFIDMNSFFASCEQAEDQALVGKPVIVVPTQGSCALSASYEAKAFGIKTGTLEREARFLCPSVIVRPARPRLYMDYHHRFAQILENLTPHVRMRSVDEASIKLCRNEDPIELGQQMKEAIWQQLGQAVNCSIGIGPNIFLAKLGTELKKPNGLTEITLENLETIYRQVELRDLCGINYATERQLHRAGIFSVLDFYQADAHYLKESLGVMGYRWWLQLHGYPSYEHPIQRKSLSHSHVLPPMHRSLPSAYKTLQRLGAKVGRRLRKAGYRAGRIALYLRFADRTGASAGWQITPAADSLTLTHHLQELWRTINPQQPILQIVVWTNNLVEAIGMPMPLFEADHRRLRLAQAIDTINDRHGTDTVRFAIIDTEGSSAPDRISFTALFDIEHE